MKNRLIVHLTPMTPMTLTTKNYECELMIKAILKDSVVGIIVVVASPVVVVVATYLLGYWPSILETLKQIWLLVISSTSTPNWLLGLMSIPCMYLVLAIGVECKEKLLKSESITTCEKYIEDNFIGLRWRWDILDGEIQNLNSFCPNCDYQILPKSHSINVQFSSFGGGYREFRYEYSCDECGYSAPSNVDNKEEFEQKVILKIHKKIRTDEWRST
jgi:hypothetical protein